MKLLPLGTVIEINNCKACVIGYTSIEKESKTVCGYFVVSYPVGFTNIDKVVFIPCSSEFTVLVEGYKTLPSERVLDIIVNGIEVVKDISQEKLIRFNQMYRKINLSKEEAFEG